MLVIHLPDTLFTEKVCTCRFIRVIVLEISQNRNRYCVWRRWANY